jgi:radical SAM enzyme (TIGR01210 family)
MQPLPFAAPERNAIRAARGAKLPVDARRPVAQWDEWEVDSPGHAVATRVLLLVGAECRFSCTMCDLWKHTLDRPTQLGDLPEQIRFGLSAPWILAERNEVSPQRWLKLYNSSNFFDAYNVPTEDLGEIASMVGSFERVIIENHPRLLSDEIRNFRDRLAGRLEVAMGLETIHPQLLAWLNKKMTVTDFAHACQALTSMDIDLRSFVLLGLPGLSRTESIHWCLESLRFAKSHRVRHCSVIPMRAKDGILLRLEKEGHFSNVDAFMLEEVMEKALREGIQIVTADMWDWEKMRGHCDVCRGARGKRLEAMNLQQQAVGRPHFDCQCAALLDK